jgi:hypothetical protein
MAAFIYDIDVAFVRSIIYVGFILALQARMARGEAANQGTARSSRGECGGADSE